MKLHAFVAMPFGTKPDAKGTPMPDRKPVGRVGEVLG